MWLKHVDVDMEIDVASWGAPVSDNETSILEPGGVRLCLHSQGSARCWQGAGGRRENTATGDKMH